MPASLCRWTLLGPVLAAALFAMALASFARPHTAAAHPMGNFTVNRYSRLDLYSDVIRIHYSQGG